MTSNPSPSIAPVRHESIAELNLPYAVLAALSSAESCTCEVTSRVKGSSAAFLMLPQAKLIDTVDTLRKQGLLESIRNGNSCAACQARYCLTPFGRYALKDFLMELESWRLAEFSLRGEVRAVNYD